MSFSSRSLALSFGILSVGALASRADAQGFGLNEIGTCAVARGFAVTGAVCNDASVIYWNPAAAARMHRNTVTAGGALIDVSGGFRQDTTQRRYAANIQAAIAPHLFINHEVTPKAAVGLGVYVPYGLTSQWNGDFPGRFSALKASLKTVYIQPNFAYAITPEWSIGGGPVVGTSHLELVQSLDLSSQFVAPSTTFGMLGIAQGTEFARGHVKGNDVAYGYNLGVHGTIARDWSVGARYLSSLKFKYKNAETHFDQVATGLTLADGNLIVQNGVSAPLDVVVASQFIGSGVLTSQTANTQITHPWQAEVGVGYSGFAGTILSADVARMGWSGFDVLPIQFNGQAIGSSRVLLEDYNDIWLYRLGVEHVVSGSGMLHGVALRGGFSYTQTPAPDETVTPLLPDMARKNSSVGVGIPIGRETQLDASYLFLSTNGRRGRVGERTSASQTAAQLNTGAYDLKANIFSLSLTTHF